MSGDCDYVFELEVILRGPEREAKYGSTRDTLARLEVPITGDRGWMIYQEAMRAAVSGQSRIVTPRVFAEEGA